MHVSVSVGLFISEVWRERLVTGGQVLFGRLGADHKAAACLFSLTDPLAKSFVVQLRVRNRLFDYRLDPIVKTARVDFAFGTTVYIYFHIRFFFRFGCFLLKLGRIQDARTARLINGLRS
jgi:hypothetical protein